MHHGAVDQGRHADVVREDLRIIGARVRGYLAYHKKRDDSGTDNNPNADGAPHNVKAAMRRVSHDSSSNQLKKQSQRTQAKNTAKHGYTTTGQRISFSSANRAKIRLAITERMIPAKRQISQDGKKEPRMLTVGARLQPAISVANSAAGSINDRRKCFTGFCPFRHAALNSWGRAPMLGLNQVCAPEGA